jgi:penicillin amidase
MTRTIVRIAVYLLAAVLALGLLVAAYAGITYWRASSGLPEWDGVLTAEGLDGPVEIVRDEHGIPYIEAATERDLYFAQGFVHAQDRFWQMALARRTSQGRLSEWFGPMTLSADRTARWFDWAGHVERSWSAVPDAEKDLLEAYAADVALVEVHPDDPDRYRRSPAAPWQRFGQRQETIRVRFGADRVDTIRSTPFGRIRSQRPGVAPFTTRSDVVEELRDLSFDHVSGFPLTLLRLTGSSTVEEGIAASEALAFPPMNISLADTSGSIGYVAAARIPRRPAPHARFVDVVPADDNDWTYLPYAENPRVVDPPSGRIVTANQRIIGDHYPHYLSDSWALPWRTLRIHEALDEREVHTMETFRAMQQDDLSPVARDLVPLLLDVEPADDTDAAVAGILRSWDYRFRLDSAAPTVFLTWAEMLSRRLIADELADVPDRRRDRQYLALIRSLSGERADWCDDRRTEAVEGCPALLRAALTDARRALEDAFGEAPSQWTWGATHRLELPHLGFAGLPLLDNLFSREVAMPGGPESLFLNSVSLLNAPHFSRAIFNSAYQGIYDLSDLDASLFMTGSGPSGHFKSPYYNNLTELWVRGERIELNPERSDAAFTLTLEPATGHP